MARAPSRSGPRPRQGWSRAPSSKCGSTKAFRAPNENTLFARPTLRLPSLGECWAGWALCLGQDIAARAQRAHNLKGCWSVKETTRCEKLAVRSSRGLPPTLNHYSTAIFERGSGLSSARSHGPGRHPQGGAGPRLPTLPHGCACTRALFEPGCDYPSLMRASAWPPHMHCVCMMATLACPLTCLSLEWPCLSPAAAADRVVARRTPSGMARSDRAQGATGACVPQAPASTEELP